MTVLIGIKSEIFLHIVFPIALVPWAVCIIKHSITLSDSIYPISFISVSNVLSLAFWLKPDMHAPALLMIIFPLSNIFLSYVCPIHRAFTIFLVVLPLAFKIVSWRVVVHFSVPLFQIVLERSFKNTSALENYFAFARLFTLQPLALICSFFYCVFTKPMSEAVFHFTFINTSVWPTIYTMTGNSVICKLTFVFDTIAPYELAFSMQ